MSGLARLFAGANFRNTIQQYCSQQGWNIAQLNDRRAVLRFTMSSGRTQTLYIIKFDATLEFSVPSVLQFSTVDAIPHYISTLLLKRSSERKVGFWCIEEISSKQTYSCMHNAEIELMNNSYFASVVRALINECDDLETLVLKMLN